MRRNNQYTPSSDWRQQVADIKAAKAEFNQYQSIMTPFERKTIGDSINALVTSAYPIVLKGATEHLNQAISTYQAAAANYDRARSKEAASWDSARLGAEINTFQMLLDRALKRDNYPGLDTGPDVISEVRRLYDEAQISGDRYKQRAAAEVVRGLRSRVDKNMSPSDAAALGVMARQAEKDLLWVRATEEFLDALDAKQQAVKALIQERDSIVEIAEVMGEKVDYIFPGGAFSKLVKTIQEDRQTGEIQILAADSPEVAGIDYLPPKGE